MDSFDMWWQAFRCRSQAFGYCWPKQDLVTRTFHRDAVLIIPAYFSWELVASWMFLPPVSDSKVILLFLGFWAMRSHVDAAGSILKNRTRPPLSLPYRCLCALGCIRHPVQMYRFTWFILEPLTGVPGLVPKRRGPNLCLETEPQVASIHQPNDQPIAVMISPNIKHQSTHVKPPNKPPIASNCHVFNH